MKSRQFQMLMYLLNHRKSTYRQLAEKFEVSTKTIERDIDVLALAGVPIYCLQGGKGGVFIQDEYTFNTGFFTEGDMQHIIFALEVYDSLSEVKRKSGIIEKLTMIDASLTNLIQANSKNYLTVDLVEKPVNAQTDICRLINLCLDEQVLANIDERENLACIEYVLKPEGLYLFAFGGEYHLLKVEDIKSIEILEEEFDRTFLTYKKFKKNSIKN